MELRGLQQLELRGLQMSELRVHGFFREFRLKGHPKLELRGLENWTTRGHRFEDYNWELEIGITRGARKLDYKGISF